jgi:hypothetical protein
MAPTAKDRENADAKKRNLPLGKGLPPESQLKLERLERLIRDEFGEDEGLLETQAMLRLLRYQLQLKRGIAIEL